MLDLFKNCNENAYDSAQKRVFKTFVGITMVFTKVISKLSQWQDFAVVKKPSTALWQNLLNALVNLEVCPRV